MNHVLVGVGTLRTMRELFRRQVGVGRFPLRAWDVASRIPVSLPGAANSLERLERVGLVEALPPRRPGGAPQYVLDPSHPLVEPLSDLFAVERGMMPPHRPFARRRGT